MGLGKKKMEARTERRGDAEENPESLSAAQEYGRKAVKMEIGSNKKAIPEHFHSLFWDVDPSTIDLLRHEDFVIERFLEYGNWENITWLRLTYGDERIVRFLKTKAYRIRSKKTLNFWQRMLGITPEECRTTRLPISSKPFSRS